MEICDVLDEFGNPTGRTFARGTTLTTGEYFMVVQVWIQNELRAYLIQKRASHLTSDPDIWATTVGHVQTGEDSIAGAIREVIEEMGIELNPSHLRKFNRLKTTHRIEDIWLAHVSTNTIDTPKLGDEVADYQWATKSEIQHMIAHDEFFAYSYFDELPE